MPQVLRDHVLDVRLGDHRAARDRRIDPAADEEVARLGEHQRPALLRLRERRRREEPRASQEQRGCERTVLRVARAAGARDVPQLCECRSCWSSRSFPWARLLGAPPYWPGRVAYREPRCRTEISAGVPLRLCAATALAVIALTPAAPRRTFRPGRTTTGGSGSGRGLGIQCRRNRYTCAAISGTMNRCSRNRCS